MISPVSGWIDFRKQKNIFQFNHYANTEMALVITILPLIKSTMFMVHCMDNIMIADGLVMQGAWALTAMVITYSF